MPGRALGAEGGGRGARLRRCGGAAAPAPQCRRSTPRHAPADEVARAVFDAAEQARVEALGARGMAGVRANLAAARRDAAEDRSAGAGAQPRRGAAGLGDRADGARAADRRGAARSGARRPGAGRRLDRGESGRRSRRARPRARRPGGVRGAGRPSCCATSSWSRASAEPDADPDAGEEGEGDDEAEGGEDEGEEDDGAGRGEAEIRGEQDRAGDDSERRRLGRGGDGRFLRRARRGGRGGHAAGPARTGRSPICRRASTIGSSPPNMTRWSTRPSCATRRNWGGCAPISTSSSSTCRARSPSSPTGCSGG